MRPTIVPSPPVATTHAREEKPKARRERQGGIQALRILNFSVRMEYITTVAPIMGPAADPPTLTMGSKQASMVPIFFLSSLPLLLCVVVTDREENPPMKKTTCKVEKREEKLL